MTSQVITKKAIQTAIKTFEAGERNHLIVKDKLEITRDAAYYLRRVAWIGNDHPEAPNLRDQLYKGEITLKEARAKSISLGRVKQSTFVKQAAA